MAESVIHPQLATMEDARRVAEVHVRARQAAYRGLIPDAILDAESVDRRETMWKRRLSNEQGRCWLLVDGDGLFGFAYTAPTRDEDLSGHCAELYALYLLEERVGCGFGRQIVKHALDDLEARGYRGVVLWYAEENVRAGRFYAAAGFETDPRIDPRPFGTSGLQRRRLRRVLGGGLCGGRAWK